MSPGSEIDVEEAIGETPLRPLHILIFALLIAAMAVDGYDIFMIAYILPVLAEGLHVDPPALTRVLVIQQFGLLLGTLVVGPLADRFGRRTVLLASLVASGLCTIATSQVATVLQLEAMRFVASIFFSAVIPTAVSLAVEFAPRRHRATAVSVVFCGYTAGNLVGATVQAWILPYGWQAAFWFGGILPLLLLPVLWAFLPESVQYRALRNGRDPTIARTLARFDPARVFHPDQAFVVRRGQGAAKRGSVAALFADGRAVKTQLLWLAFLAACIFTYIANSWGTTLLHVTRQIPMTDVAMLMASSATAGIVGTATSGFIIDRFGAGRVLPLYLVGAAVSIVVIAAMDLDSVWAPAAFAALGFCSNSGWGGLNAVSSMLYPPEIRGTGVSWAVGAGKVGAMIGPVIGGVMIANHWDLTPIYLLAAIPELVAAAAIFLLLAGASARPRLRTA